MLDLDVAAGPTTTVSLRGDLDPATAPALTALIAELAADASIEKVVLDLAKLDFIDSSWLRVFVTSSEALAQRGAAFVLRDPSANTRRLLDLTGLGEIISIE